MPERPDLDERFSLHPLEGEEVLRELLRDDPESDADDCADEAQEDDGL